MPDPDERDLETVEVPEEARAEALLEGADGEDSGAQDPEAPEADAAEQHADVLRRAQRPTETPTEVDPADLADQHADVELDEDDYR